MFGFQRAPLYQYELRRSIEKLKEIQEQRKDERRAEATMDPYAFEACHVHHRLALEKEVAGRVHGNQIAWARDISRAEEGWDG